MEIPFSIPVTGVIRLDGDRVIITVNRAETSVDVPFPAMSSQFSILEPGQSMDSVILDAAREYVKHSQNNRFNGPELFEVALEHNPRLNKRSFLSRVIAVTPNHPSYHHFASGKDYFEKIGKGQYRLSSRYLPDPNAQGLFANNS
jgi:hypothetical protein